MSCHRQRDGQQSAFMMVEDIDAKRHEFLHTSPTLASKLEVAAPPAKVSGAMCHWYYTRRRVLKLNHSCETTRTIQTARLEFVPIAWKPRTWSYQITAALR